MRLFFVFGQCVLSLVGFSCLLFCAIVCVQCEAPNVLQLRRESLGKAVLDRYRKATLRSGVYRAAAKLWASGVLSWEDALQAVEDALGVNLDDTA